MCVTCVTYISVRVRASTTMQTHTHMRNISWWVKKKKRKEKRGGDVFFSLSADDQLASCSPSTPSPWNSDVHSCSKTRGGEISACQEMLEKHKTHLETQTFEGGGCEFMTPRVAQNAKTQKQQQQKKGCHSFSRRLGNTLFPGSCDQFTLSKKWHVLFRAREGSNSFLVIKPNQITIVLLTKF